MRVNVGCGATPTPGWVNFDNSLTVRLAAMPWLPLPSNRKAFVQSIRDQGIRWADATNLPIPEGSAEVIYSSHMMEHLDRGEVRRFLASALRSLKPGGVLRLVLPDLRRRAEAYVRDGDADAFVESLMMAAGRPHGATAWLKHVVVGPRDHLWMYDGPSLCRLLREAGFSDARELAPGETRIAGPEPLDLHERDDESVYVEAIRP